MPSKEPIASWEKTSGHLLDARSHLSQAAEGICADEIHEFQEYLEYNELELALDSLEAACEKSPKTKSTRTAEIPRSARNDNFARHGSI